MKSLKWQIPPLLISFPRKEEENVGREEKRHFFVDKDNPRENFCNTSPWYRSIIARNILYYNFDDNIWLFSIPFNRWLENKIKCDNSRLDNRFDKCIDSSLDELQSASKFNYCNPIVLLVHHRLAKWNTITRCLPGEPPIACEPWNPISCGFLADSGVESKPYQRLSALKNTSLVIDGLG